MSERKCAHCKKIIKMPHVRVWEENIIISRMITFCSLKCMVLHYRYIEDYPKLELQRDDEP